MYIKNQKHIALKRVALFKWWVFLDNQSKFTWYQHFILKRPTWLNNIYYDYDYYYYFLIWNYWYARLSGECLLWKPCFNHSFKKWEYYSQNGQEWLLPNKIKWNNHDQHLSGMALLVDTKASARLNKYAWISRAFFLPRSFLRLLS